MSAFMIAGAVIDVSRSTDAMALIKHRGYQAYFVPFIGVMKILGVIALMIPGYLKLKEWEYAGLVFDASNALFSHISTGDTPDKWLPAGIGLILVVSSYLLYNQNGRHLQASHF